MVKVTKKPQADSQMSQRIVSLEEQLRRTLADYANLEKRVERERQVYLTLNTITLVSKFVEVLDDFLLANHHLNDPGLKMAIDKFFNALKTLGINTIKADPGDEFDHLTMECIGTTPGENNKVVVVHKPGYSYDGQLIRPAQVTVGQSPSNLKPTD